ncbi:hypothetical protein LXM94_11845 [Rhizobium sp. TRM95111]|uniref:hypothetical protein n=1 Tax=Rhizobium alarense TaxID=2846851 RepID=UPI001F389437|nr:hypothetical protein [Rhizobium alarense]MCF3640657.1 hypothetical protein [Rhizobium alarense]
MISITIRDSITDAGRPGGQNEDRSGATPQSAFVLDGATGLADERLFPDFRSDAEWLADFACRRFLEADGAALRDAVDAINRQAGEAVAAAAGGRVLPAWALPIAGFQMVRLEDGALVSYGLGDCRLFLRSDADGAVFETSALRGNAAAEREEARRSIAQAGGLQAYGTLSAHAAVREKLRESRARCNRPGARVWTLGTVPGAADHVVREVCPVGAPATGLLCSDGFAALCDQYGRYDPAGLVMAAAGRGLADLLGELRDIERRLDPDGRAYPRYKTSDDATAVLFRVDMDADRA